MKMEGELAGMFEKNITWDEMIGRFTDTYVVWEDREM